MEVWFGVPKKLNVQFLWFECFPDCFCHQSHLFEKAVANVWRELMKFVYVTLGEKQRIPSVELVVTENDVACIQLRDERGILL